MLLALLVGEGEKPRDLSLYICSRKRVRQYISARFILVLDALLTLSASLLVRGISELTKCISWGTHFIFSIALVLRTISFVRFGKIGGRDRDA